MALRKDTTPAFEEETVATGTAETVPEISTPSVEDTSKVAATTAIAKAQTGAVALGKKYAPALSSLQNVIDPSAIDFDTFPRFTVGLDGFSDENENEKGKKLKLQLLSWNERYVATTGKDDAESSELVRFSLDGKTIDGTGEDVLAYVQKLREVDGYDEASLKKYYALYGFLVATSETGDLVDVAPEDRRIVSIQIPPRSVGKFTGFQVEQGVKISQGIIEESDLIVLTQNKVKGKSRTYAEILFSAK